MPSFALVPNLNYRMLRFVGPEAGVLLQGQTTCDVNGLNPTTAGETLFCQFQGKVFSAGVLYMYSPTEYRYILHETLIDSTVHSLQPFCALHKTEIIPSDCVIYGLIGTSIPTELPGKPWQTATLSTELLSVCLQTQPHLHLLVGEKHHADSWLSKQDDVQIKPISMWHAACISQHLLYFSAASINQFTPNMLYRPPCLAVSLNKGCYVGQEVIARTHHLGRPKRQVFYLVSDQIHTAIPAGTQLSLAESNASATVMCSSYHHNQLWMQVVMPTSTPPYEFILNANNEAVSFSALTAGI